MESIPKTGFCVPKESLEVQNADFPKAIGMTDAINWSSVLPKDDPDTAVMIWQNKFLDIMDECLPVQCLPQRRRPSPISYAPISTQESRHTDNVHTTKPDTGQTDGVHTTQPDTIVLVICMTY